ncbi:hypothetical protein [Streptomyces similanensis]|uniref:ATP-binding protein n=1 Tax=Streptomyces similanensis TaxID=1274988 RepID=A0ABP9L748_9ACTN
MTISDATPHNLTAGPPAADIASLTSPVSAMHFVIGPHCTPIEAMGQAAGVTSAALPLILEGLADAANVCADVQAVLTELVDITARHRAGDLVGSITYDGAHVTVSVGDMDCPLPAPEVEPGLYLVRGLATDVGQYAGDHGGRVTWAAVAVRS